jgi:hypothetical protein
VKSDEELELEDIAEQAEEVGKLSPREYAKLRKITPQLVYYYLRTGKIKEERCICGRKVIDVATADSYLASQQEARRVRSGQPVLLPDEDDGQGQGTAL